MSGNKVIGSSTILPPAYKTVLMWASPKWGRGFKTRVAVLHWMEIIVDHSHCQNIHSHSPQITVLKMFSFFAKNLCQKVSLPLQCCCLFLEEAINPLHFTLDDPAILQFVVNITRTLSWCILAERSIWHHWSIAVMSGGGVGGVAHLPHDRFFERGGWKWPLLLPKRQFSIYLRFYSPFPSPWYRPSIWKLHNVDDDGYKTSTEMARPAACLIMVDIKHQLLN